MSLLLRTKVIERIGNKLLNLSSISVNNKVFALNSKQIQNRYFKTSLTLLGEY
jgi:hypothetical protein